MNMMIFFMAIFLLLVAGQFLGLALAITITGTLLIAMYPVIYLFNPTVFIIQILCIGGLWAGYFILRAISDTYITEEKQAGTRGANLIAYEKSLSDRLHDLQFDMDCLKKGYGSALGFTDLLRTMGRTMEFENILHIFVRKLHSLFECASCQFILLAGYEAEHIIEKYYSFPSAPDGKSGYPCDRLLKCIQAGIRAREKNRITEYIRGRDIIFYLPDASKFLPVIVLSGMRMTTVGEIKPLLNPFYMELKKSLLFDNIRKLSLIDGLTQLYQRRYFLVCLEEELQRAKTYKRYFAVLMLDIDDFKQYNDRYGHLIGDFILREIGVIIHDTMRQNDLAGRYGGEEFIFFLPNTGQKGAASMANRLLSKIAAHTFRAYGLNLNVTVSIGTAIYPEHAGTMDGLIRYADKQLYRAKADGKNCVRT